MEDLGPGMVVVVLTVPVMSDPPDDPPPQLPRGRNVRALLDQLAPGRTLQWLSMQMGMPERTMSDLLSATRGPAARGALPDADVIDELARVLECPPEAVLTAFARDAGLLMADGLTPTEHAVIAKATSLPRRLRSVAFNVFQLVVDEFATEETRQRRRRTGPPKR